MFSVPYDCDGSYNPDCPESPLVTIGVLRTPISTWVHPNGREVHLLVGPLTLILLPQQAVEIAAVLGDATS